MSQLVQASSTAGRDYSAWVAIQAACRDLYRHRWGIYIAFSRNLKASYRATVLGFIWSLIRPIVPITAYVLMATLRVIVSTDEMPRTVYITIGFTVWFLCTGLIKQPMRAVNSQRSILRSSQYPLVAIIAASTAQLFFETTIRASLILIIIFGFGLVPSVWTPVALLILLVGCLGSAGLGILALVLSAVYPDVKDIINITLRYGTFLSAVIFPIPDSAAWLRIINPFYTLITAVRGLIIGGQLSVELLPFVAMILCSLLIFVFSIRLLYRMEPHLRGHLG